MAFIHRILTLAVVACALLFLGGCADRQDEIDELQAQLEEKNSQIEDIRSDFDDLQGSIESLSGEVYGFSDGSDWADVVGSVEASVSDVESLASTLDATISDAEY